MKETTKVNNYTNVSLLLTTVGALHSIQKSDYYLDIMILAAALTCAIVGYYKK